RSAPASCGNRPWVRCASTSPKRSRRRRTTGRRSSASAAARSSDLARFVVGDMTELRFVAKPVPMTIAEIAALTGAEPLASTPLDRAISGGAQLERAGPTDLAFLDHAKYSGQLPSTRAGCCLIAERFVEQVPPH